MNCIRKPPSASMGTVCEYAHSGMIGIDNRAAITIAFRRPIFSDHVPKIIPPSSAPMLAMMAMNPTVCGANLWSFVRNVGYRSWLPWLNELNANIRTTRKMKVPT